MCDMFCTLTFCWRRMTAATIACHGVQQQDPTEALDEVVQQACARVDARLKGRLLDKLGFLRHCEALKKLLFFGQGDFAAALVHHTADLLPRRASQVHPHAILNNQPVDRISALHYILPFT